jgi:hypothetical protein
MKRIIAFIAGVVFLTSCGQSDETKLRVTNSVNSYYNVVDDLQANKHRLVLMQNIKQYEPFITNGESAYIENLVNRAAALEVDIQKAHDAMTNSGAIEIIEKVENVTYELDSLNNLVWLTNLVNKIDASKASENLDFQIILIDQVASYQAVFARTSWDESYDNTEIDHTFVPVSISEEEYLELNAKDEQDINVAEIRYSNDITDYSNAFKRVRTNGLNIRENWPNDNHDYADYWVSDTRGECYHKYLIEINGDTLTTDWIRVPEEVYDEYRENLNMTIYYKTKDQKEYYAGTNAVPPGFFEVGNEQYGSWQEGDYSSEPTENTTGHSEARYWRWSHNYPSYRYYHTPYSYGEYQTYQTGYKKYGYDYYGVDKKGYRQYGTNSLYSQKNLGQVSKTKYYQTHPTDFNPSKDSHPKAPIASMRGAGKSIRGGGPGGGGK